MAKRFTKSNINWTELEKLVPSNQKHEFLHFKGKSFAYAQRMSLNPPEPPKIDWEFYKKTVPVKDFVDKYQKSYENFKVPYPEDKLSAQVDDQWKKLEREIKTFCDERQEEIDGAKKEVARINALPKFEDMTMETYFDMYPDQALNPVKKPTFWPHDEEEQPGYKPKVVTKEK